MPDLDDLTRAELKALVTALSDRKDEQAYDPDSLMAMMLASPKNLGQFHGACSTQPLEHLSLYFASLYFWDY